MLAQNNQDLAEMLQDPMFVQPIELRDSFTYELPQLDARGGKKIIGSHIHRTNVALYGALNLHGRFQFSDLTFRIAPGVNGVNCAWGTHSTFTECGFGSLDKDNAGITGIWSDPTADNNNSYGIHIDRCAFWNLQIGLQIQLGANHVVGGWTIRDTDFSHNLRWGLHVRGAAALYLENVLFQVNGRDASLHGTEIELHHCHAERQQSEPRISVVIARDSSPVLFCGGGMAYQPHSRIVDFSGKAIFIGGQDSKAMLVP